MTPPDLGQPLFLKDHGERFAQAEQMGGGRGAAEILVEIDGEAPRLPVPVGRCEIGSFRNFVRLVGKPDEAQAGWQHEALLAGANQHVDTPFIHPHLVAGERGDGIDGEQRRMPDRIDGGTDGGNVAAGGRGRIDMGDEDGADGMGGVGGKRFGDADGIDRRGFAEVDQIDNDAHAAGRIGPAKPKATGGGHQRPVAARKHVGDRRFPGPMAVGDVDGDVLVGQCHALEIGDNRLRHADDIALINIGGGPMHGVEDAIGGDRGTGDGEVGAAGIVGHRRLQRR